jgi:hypothetical protein
MDDPFRERRLPPAEVRRVLRRAAELAEEDAETEGAEQSLATDDVVRAAAELGIPSTAVKRAMREALPAKAVEERGGLFGPPLRTLLEDEIDGEIGPEMHEDIVDAIQVVMGDAGRVQIVGKTLTWQPTMTPQNPPRALTVTVRARNGRTILRVDERHTNLALGLYLGLGLGLGLGGGMPLVAGLTAAFKSVLISALGFVGMALFALFLARTIYTVVARKRERAAGELMERLRVAVRSAHAGPRVAAEAPARARIGAANAEDAEGEAMAEDEAIAEERKASRRR